MTDETENNALCCEIVVIIEDGAAGCLENGNDTNSLAWRRLGFSYSGLGETNTRAFGLAEVCRGTLTGQRAVAYWRARSIIRVLAVISRIRYCVLVPPRP